MTNSGVAQALPVKYAHGFAVAVVFLFPVLILVLRPADGLGLGLLSLAGFWVLYQQRGGEQASREEKLLYFALSFFFLAALFVTLLGGIDDSGLKKIGKFARLLLVIPAYVFLRRVGVSLAALWYGLVAGSVVAAGVALFEVWDRPPTFRARGITHPIIFGDIALILGVMALAGLGWFKQRARWQMLLPLLALSCGLLASLLSHARGGWLAIPFLGLVFLWYSRARIPVWQRWSAMMVLALVVVGAYFVPATGVQKTVDRTVTSLSNYFQSDITSSARGTSVGTRLEMWQAAGQIYLDNPVFGVGWGHYQENAQALVGAGLRNRSAATWGHPHNQFFAAMANGGTLALAAILLLFMIPAKLLVDVMRRKKNIDQQRLALAGLLLIVAYMSFGFSEAILERDRPISFFVFYLAVIFAAIATQSQASRREPNKRQQSLSVIIIAQDEASRIEPCLQSVANWADEIIVFDSGSSDNTVEIVRRYTDRVFETDWPGYGRQKQRALEKASGDWVLSIDADEVVTPELREEIDALLSGTPEAVGYRLPWAVMLFGKRLDFGRSGRAPLRLVRREGARFSQAMVHEHIILPEGNVGKMQGRLLHNSHRNFRHAIDKFSTYAELWSQQRFEKGKRSGILNAVVHGGWMFFMVFIVRLGFLDGRRGFLMAVLYGQYTFNKYAALWSLSIRNDSK